MKSILITGANRGIGLGLTQYYLKQGWYVYAGCRNPDAAVDLQNLSTTFPHLSIIKLDVSQPESIQHLAQTLNDAPLDILINNAGVLGPNESAIGLIGEHQPSVSDTKTQPWLEVLKVNTIAPLLMVQALLPNLRQGQLKIIANITSSLGSIADNDMGGYYIYRASKSALNAITKSMAVDLKREQFIVLALNPGWVKTNMGGENAQITVEECVKGLANVLSTTAFSDSGKFLNYQGEPCKW